MIVEKHIYQESRTVKYFNVQVEVPYWTNYIAAFAWNILNMYIIRKGNKIT
ncbi:hypothetical protein [Photorhabdus sp. RM323S]|uniref:hypothetical protein n=1 Tax=Photorhabdus sp. RM323S TaxID=3342828 RepID=UPI0036DE227B